MRKYRKSKPLKYKKGKQVLVFGLGAIPKEGVPEIRIRYNKSKKGLSGNILNSLDAAGFIRKLYTRGSIELQEAFIVVYLDHANQVLGYYKHTVGTIDATIIDIRLIIGAALKSASVGMIIAHNHPSGSLKTSAADNALTNRIATACSLFNIALLDHLILTKNGYYSYNDNNKLAQK